MSEKRCMYEKLRWRKRKEKKIPVIDSAAILVQAAFFSAGREALSPVMFWAAMLLTRGASLPRPEFVPVEAEFVHEKPFRSRGLSGYGAERS